MSDLVQQLDAEHPGLLKYYRTLGNYFMAGGAFAQQMARVARILEHIPRPILDAAAREWKELGILPGVTIETDQQVGSIWKNPLFLAFMESMEFSPGPRQDLREALPERVQSKEQFAARRFGVFTRLMAGSLASGQDKYWRISLALQAPELYLQPFLHIHPKPLQGCDLACGWGRACLTLPDYQDLTIQACDLAPQNLERLGQLAANRDLTGVVHPVQADITQLPFSDGQFHFFLAFDIFEHLTDEALDRALQEILRCAAEHAILYAEIPVQAYCPALTHIQNFTVDDLFARFHSTVREGRTFRVAYHDGAVPEQFAFCVVQESMFPLGPGSGA